MRTVAISSNQDVERKNAIALLNKENALELLRDLVYAAALGVLVGSAGLAIGVGVTVGLPVAVAVLGGGVLVTSGIVLVAHRFFGARQE
jgi:hypothetical protein